MNSYQTTIPRVLVILLSLACASLSTKRLLLARTQNQKRVNTVSRPSATPSPGAQQNAEDIQALAEINQRLAGREDEIAEIVFKNIEILKGKKASRLPGMMKALTGLLGVGCDYCHIRNQWEREDKPTKQTARKMFRMMAAINNDNFDGRNAVSCWTCHRGNPRPPIQ